MRRKVLEYEATLAENEAIARRSSAAIGLVERVIRVLPRKVWEPLGCHASP